MSQSLIGYLEDNSLAIMAEALSDARVHAGASLVNVTDDDLQVAFYTLLLKIIDTLREKSDEPVEAAPDIRTVFLHKCRGIMEFIDGQSSYTSGHTSAVVRHCVQIASRLGMTDEQIDDIEYVAWIHNIGLINQSHRLATLPRPLTQDEIAQARNHTVLGAEIIRPIDFLAHYVPIIRYHHHSYDGGGKAPFTEPRGENLPLGARIICLADAYQAMLEPRAYRGALKRKEALLEISKRSGSQFDPKLISLAHELT